MKRLFVVNPSAGGLRRAQKLAEIQAWFKARTGKFDYEIGESRSQLTLLTRLALRQGVDQIVALGGDGTLNAVANGFFEAGQPIAPDTALAAANLGTGSDFFRGVSDGQSDWRELVLGGEGRLIDVGQVEFARGDQPPQVFLNVAGIGLSPEVVRRKQSKWLKGWGAAGYTAAALGAILEYRPVSATVRLGSQTHSGPWLGIFIAKGKYLGGGMKLGTEPGWASGKFTCTLIRPVSIPFALTRLPKLFCDGITGVAKVQQILAAEIAVGSPSPLPVEFDGECLGSTPVRFTLHRQSLRVCFPKSGTECESGG